MLIKQNIIYTLNFKPLLNHKKELINSNSQIYCKNFFLFFLLLNKILNREGINLNKKIKVSLFKTKRLKAKSTLRAPNKYKKGQINLNLLRYTIVFKFNYYYNLASFNINSKLIFNSLLNFLIIYFNFFMFFESSLFYLKKKNYKFLFSNILLKYYFLKI